MPIRSCRWDGRLCQEHRVLCTGSSYKLPRLSHWLIAEDEKASLVRACRAVDCGRCLLGLCLQGFVNRRDSVGLRMIWRAIDPKHSSVLMCMNQYDHHGA
eukprot:4242794-Amphidinium_carterae.2